MIYSPTRHDWHVFHPELFVHLSAWNNQPGSIFLYNELDRFGAGIELGDAFTAEHWNHLNTDPDSKLLISYCSDYVNAYDLEQFNVDLKKHNVDTRKVWFLAMDPLFQKFVQDRLDIPREQVGYFNFLPSNLYIPEYNQQPTSFKFSMLSRNYRNWRLDIYLRLLSKNILNQVTYSFHNYDPYNFTNHTIEKSTVIADANKLGFSNLESLEWIANMPYDIPNSDLQNKWHHATHNAIQSSAVSLCIESHYDPYVYWPELRGFDPDEFSPAFATEKIYKTIACSRPFIVISTPGFLRGLREMGFKTFDGIIDESYDMIVDDYDRMTAITSEVERLSLLPADEFNKLITDCADIVKYNYDHLINMRSTDTLIDQWQWLKTYIKK